MPTITPFASSFPSPTYSPYPYPSGSFVSFDPGDVAAGFGAVWGIAMIIQLVFFLVAIAIMVIWIIFLIKAIIDISHREFDNPSDRTMWLLIVIIGGVIGVIVYYVAGRKTGKLPPENPPNPPTPPAPPTPPPSTPQG